MRLKSRLLEASANARSLQQRAAYLARLSIKNQIEAKKSKFVLY